MIPIKKVPIIRIEIFLLAAKVMRNIQKAKTNDDDEKAKYFSYPSKKGEIYSS
jgi:hypothetical protein